jgi:hypothetical protein
MSADKPIKIVGVDRIDEDQIVVEFPDSAAVYTIEQLASLKPAETVTEDEETTQQSSD